MEEKKVKNKKREETDNNGNSKFIIILFAFVVIIVFFFPKLYGAIEKARMPKIKFDKDNTEKTDKVVDDELLDSLHRPLMRSSIYNSNTYEKI